MNTLRAEIAQLHVADLHRAAARARRAAGATTRVAKRCSALCRAAAYRRSRWT